MALSLFASFFLQFKLSENFLIGTIVGGVKSSYFPLFVYFPIFVVGFNYDYIKNCLPRLVNFLWSLAALCLVFFLDYFDNLRFPVSFIWVLGNIVVVYPIVRFLEVIFVKCSRRNSILFILGRNVLFSLLLSNLFIFYLVSIWGRNSLDDFALIFFFVIFLSGFLISFYFIEKVVLLLRLR